MSVAIASFTVDFDYSYCLVLFVGADFCPYTAPPPLPFKLYIVFLG